MKIKKYKYTRRGRIRQAIEKSLIYFVARLGCRYRPFHRRNPLEIQELTIPIASLPEVFNGFRIVHLSDIHHGPYTCKEDLERIVALVNNLNPDLIALTGDYILNSIQYIDECLEAIGRLQAKEGLVAVLGNHDHREGADIIEKALIDRGIPVLRNRNFTLERQGENLDLVGVGDLEEDIADLDKAFSTLPPHRPRILLSHNPDIVEILDGHRADLVLSGHTHGGQIMLPLIGPPFLPIHYKRYREGLVQGPTAPVYISRGVGATLLPIRFFCPPEITVLTLEQK